MRKFWILFLIVALLALVGCKAESSVPSTAPGDTTAPAETTIPVETISPVETTVPVETTLPAETVTPTTEASTEPAATESSTLPYLQRIDRADQSIFDGPGYDYALVGTVRERGTYTIVEEEWDYEGNLWGKLKSGAGWVNLTQIRSEDYAESLISANYADENLLLHGAYHYCPCEETEYFVTIAFRAYAKLRDVEIFVYEWRDDGFFPGGTFFTLSEWTPDMPLVAELSFPGDLSTYGIRFVDENGVTHIFDISISGRNGEVVLIEQ